MAKRKKGHSYNESIGQAREHKTTADMSHETEESEDYGQNINVMRGHTADSRFDEGSTHSMREAKIVRPSLGNHATSKFHAYMKGGKK